MAERGRGFVHEHQARIGHQRTRNRDDLAVGDGQGADRQLDVQLHAQAGQDGTRGFAHRTVVDPVRTGAQVLLERDVLGHAHFREQRQILPDHLYAQFARTRRVQAFEMLAVEDHAAAGLRLVDPADDLDQRALAAAVFADQAQHFADHQVKLHGLQRLDPAKGHGNVVELEQRARRRRGGGPLGRCRADAGCVHGTAFMLHRDVQACLRGARTGRIRNSPQAVQQKQETKTYRPILARSSTVLLLSSSSWSTIRL